MEKLTTEAPSVLQNAKDFVVTLFLVLYYYMVAIFKFFVPPEPKSLVGKVVLVTGSAGGIGRQICTQLAKTGAILICWDVDKRNNDTFVKELVSETGVKAFSYQVDVSDRSQVQQLLQSIIKMHGEIDIIINNAGIMPCKPFLNQTQTELVKSFEINVFAHFWILQEILPRMIERNEGHIVTMCSAAGLIPTRNLAAYSGTKHAVQGFIEALKEELRHDIRKPNIQFTTVYPFACSTGLMSGIKSYSRFPSIVKTILEPEEVAAQLIDGLRRNYEHVYVPRFVAFAGTTAKGLIPDVQRISVDFMNCYVTPEKAN